MRHPAAIRYPGLSPVEGWLLKQQHGCCDFCGQRFWPDDVLECHHRDGVHQNNHRSNLAMVHRHCHDALHRQRPPPEDPNVKFL